MLEEEQFSKINASVEELGSQILETAQKITQKGLVIATWGNISARVSADLFLITPSGLDYATLTQDDLVVINLEGETIVGQRRPSTEMPLHKTLYQKYPQVQAIVHTHSLFASVLAVARIPLPPILEELAQLVGGTIPVSDYALAGSHDLAEAVAKALETVPAVLLANHGLVSVGKTLTEAGLICEIVEKGAQVYTYARMLGTPHLLPVEVVKELQDTYQKKYGQNPLNQP